MTCAPLSSLRRDSHAFLETSIRRVRRFLARRTGAGTFRAAAFVELLQASGLLLVDRTYRGVRRVGHEVQTIVLSVNELLANLGAGFFLSQHIGRERDGRDHDSKKSDATIFGHFGFLIIKMLLNPDLTGFNPTNILRGYSRAPALHPYSADRPTRGVYLAALPFAGVPIASGRVALRHGSRLSTASGPAPPNTSA